MMPRVKAIKISKIQVRRQDFHKEFLKRHNTVLYFNLCSYMFCCGKQFFVESHLNASKHKKR